MFIINSYVHVESMFLICTYQHQSLKRLANHSYGSESISYASSTPSLHVSIAFIPTLLKLTRIHWLIGLSLNEAKTFLKVPVSIKVVTPGPRKMQIHFVRYTTSARFGKNPQIFTQCVGIYSTSAYYSLSVKIRSK